jgi:hypothetical protein
VFHADERVSTAGNNENGGMMGTKERLAEKLEKLARLIPGIGSYQDKEGLREGDKHLRETLALRLDGARRTLEEVISQRQRAGRFEGLDRLGALERRLHHAADTVRFAARGYSGTFDRAKVGEEKLETIYTFDISMAETVSAVEEAAEGLKGAASDDQDPVAPLETRLATFQDKLQERDRLFRQQT